MRLTIALILFFLTTGPAIVRAGTPQSNPEHHIESIVIEGNRYTKSAIVRSASRLKEGRSYSEKDLRSAIARVQRLPFVREAEMSLRRGSERGKYQLVIEIVELAPFFGDFSTTWLDYDAVDGGRFSDDDARLTARYFFGRSSMIFASAIPNRRWSDDDGGFIGVDLYQAGYTEYDLFGQGIFLTLDVLYSPGQSDDFVDSDDQISPGLLLTIPMFENNWLRVQGRTTEVKATLTDFDTGGDADFSARSDLFSLAWEYNTTDDSWLPMSGLLASLTFGHSDFHSEERDERLDSRIRSLVVDVAHYQPITPRQSWFAKGSARLSDERSDETIAGGPGFSFEQDRERLQASAGYHASFWRRHPNQRYGDLALIVTSDYVWGETRSRSFGLVETEGTFTTRGWSSSATLRYRNAWGALTAGLVVVHEEDFDADLVR